MKTLYDADGKAYQVEPVDAREWVKSGGYSETPPVVEEAQAKSQADAGKVDEAAIDTNSPMPGAIEQAAVEQLQPAVSAPDSKASHQGKKK